VIDRFAGSSPAEVAEVDGTSGLKTPPGPMPEGIGSGERRSDMRGGIQPVSGVGQRQWAWSALIARRKRPLADVGPVSQALAWKRNYSVLRQWVRLIVSRAQADENALAGHLKIEVTWVWKRHENDPRSLTFDHCDHAQMAGHRHTRRSVQHYYLSDVSCVFEELASTPIYHRLRGLRRDIARRRRRTRLRVASNHRIEKRSGPENGHSQGEAPYRGVATIG
jgi:hypothetical protein